MAGLVKSAQAVTCVFTTAHPSTGAATNADSLPTGTLYVNGTSNAASVTVTNITTGVYKAALTLPSLAGGDVVDLRISATVNSIAGEAVVWSATADTKRVSDLVDAAAAPSVGAIRTELDANSTKLANLDAAVSSRSTYAGGAVASVTGNVGGNVVGSVGSLTGYTAPDNTSITAIKAKTDALPASPAATGDIPSAASIASAVWGAASRTLTAFGFSVSVDPAAVWDALTSGLTTAGSIGALLISKLTSPTITVTSPVASDATLTLVRGDDYSASDNRAVTLTLDTGDTLTGGSATLTIGALALTGGTVTNTSGTVWDLTWHPTATQTALLTEHTYGYTAQVTRAGRVLTEVIGTATVRP